MKTLNSFLMAALVAVPALAAECAPQTKDMQLTVGQTRMMVLNSNATTGYMWKVVSGISADSAVKVELVDGTVESDSMCCGFPVPVTLKITGAKPGKALVHLVYARPWEKGKKPARELRYMVTVAAPAK